MLSKPASAQRLVVAITGASGSRYALRLVRALLECGAEVSLLLSRAGADVLQYETGVDWRGNAAEVEALMRGYFASDRLCHYGCDDLFAPVASGSSAPDGVIIVPCSMGCVGRIASGVGNTLIERVADVALKDRARRRCMPFTSKTCCGSIGPERLSSRRCRPIISGRRPSTISMISWRARSSICSASSTSCFRAGLRNQTRTTHDRFCNTGRQTCRRRPA